MVPCIDMTVPNMSSNTNVGVYKNTETCFAQVIILMFHNNHVQTRNGGKLCSIYLDIGFVFKLQFVTVIGWMLCISYHLLKLKKKMNTTPITSHTNPVLWYTCRKRFYFLRLLRASYNVKYLAALDILKWDRKGKHNGACS